MRILTNTDFRAYGGRYVIEYLLRAGNGGAEVSLGHATWADWDQRGRLILARDGLLLHWESPGLIHLIADFSDQTPDPQPAPAWATTWPDRPAKRQRRSMPDQ